MNQPNSMKVPKVVKPMNGKRYFKTLGTTVINSQMSPPSLGIDLDLWKKRIKSLEIIIRGIVL